MQVRQLQQQLAAREQEVAALREIAEAATELQSQDVQAAKVIELSKKVSSTFKRLSGCCFVAQQQAAEFAHWFTTLQNRSLNLILEKEKQKVAKLQQELSQASCSKAAAGEVGVLLYHVVPCWSQHVQTSSTTADLARCQLCATAQWHSALQP